MFGEAVPNLGHGAVAVVREDTKVNSYAPRAKCLIGHFFIADSRELAGPAHNRAFDVLGGHVGRLRVVDKQAQPRVGIQIASAGTRRDGHFLDQTCENAPPLGIRGGLLVLDGMPF